MENTNKKNCLKQLFKDKNNCRRRGACRDTMA